MLETYAVCLLPARVELVIPKIYMALSGLASHQVVWLREGKLYVLKKSERRPTRCKRDRKGGAQ
jgi:hypothetical protein